MLISRQFIRSGCEFFETIQYLNLLEITTLYHTLKAAGYLEDFYLGDEPEPASVKASVKDPLASPLLNQTITGSRPFLFSIGLQHQVFQIN